MHRLQQYFVFYVLTEVQWWDEKCDSFVISIITLYSSTHLSLTIKQTYTNPQPPTYHPPPVSYRISTFHKDGRRPFRRHCNIGCNNDTNTADKTACLYLSKVIHFRTTRQTKIRKLTILDEKDRYKQLVT